MRGKYRIPRVSTNCGQMKVAGSLENTEKTDRRRNYWKNEDTSSRKTEKLKTAQTGTNTTD